MSNFLESIKRDTIGDIFTNINSGVIEIDEKITTTGILIQSSVPEEKRRYIRLGTFLEYLQREVLINMDNGSGCFPLFYINTSDECVMKAKPKLISVDPQTCIIKPNFGIMGIETPDWAKNMKPFFNVKS